VAADTEKEEEAGITIARTSITFGILAHMREL
jgi:hypothetical protein